MESILVAEDEPEVREYLELALSCEGFEVAFAANGEEVVNRLRHEQKQYSLLLLDLIMPKKDGFETLKEVRSGWPDLPVITLSGSCSPGNVAAVLKAGASDFLSKPVAHEDLGKAIRNALSLCPPTKLIPAEPVRPERPFWEAPSKGSWSQRAASLVEQLASSDVPVLLRGETGVGKEVMARSLHQRSTRAGRPFLKLNCAALPSELIESELFGYERGAFTGAFKNAPGKFELANGGTILLDEIGDMDFKLQAKLLQVLQDREFHRLGSKEISRVDVRVMAATHCELERAVAEGKFREDLYYRLNIIEIHVPPLRERKDEIVSLANTFLEKHSPNEPVELPQRLQTVLLHHDWPGNVRELENIIRKFLVFRDVDVIAEELHRRTSKRAAVRNSVAGHRSDPVPAPRAAPDRSSEHSIGIAEVYGAMPPAVPSTARPAYTTAFSDMQPDALSTATPASILDRVDEARRNSEREAILQALHTTLWNRKHAAKLLQIDYKALLYKMKKLGLGANVREDTVS